MCLSDGRAHLLLAGAAGSARKAIETRPFAPSCLTTSVSASISLRENSAPPVTHSPSIEPPLSTADLKTTNSVPRTACVKSTSSMPKRRSGLSVPKRRSDSA